MAEWDPGQDRHTSRVSPGPGHAQLPARPLAPPAAPLPTGLLMVLDAHADGVDQNSHQRCWLKVLAVPIAPQLGCVSSLGCCFSRSARRRPSSSSFPSSEEARHLAELRATSVPASTLAGRQGRPSWPLVAAAAQAEGRRRCRPGSRGSCLGRRPAWWRWAAPACGASGQGAVSGHNSWKGSRGQGRGLGSCRRQSPPAVGLAKPGSPPA